MNNNLLFKGCGTALVTPFREGKVDFDALAALVSHQVAAGINFLVPLGTTAETPCLTNEEKVEILKAVKSLSGNLKLLAGAGTNSLEGTKKNIDLLAPHGADAFLIVTPYYNKPTQDGLFAYYTAVAEHSPKPIVIYNVPGRTGVNISAETTLRLAANPNIIGIKEASGNYAQISRIIGDAPEGFAVLSGNDDETLSLMATGAAGVISVVSNVAPELMVALTSAMAQNDLAAGRELHHRLFSLSKALFVESNPIPAKAALALMGVMSDEMRLPLVSASSSTKELVSNVLKNLNLL